MNQDAIGTKRMEDPNPLTVPMISATKAKTKKRMYFSTRRFSVKIEFQRILKKECVSLFEIRSKTRV